MSSVIANNDNLQELELASNEKKPILIDEGGEEESKPEAPIKKELKLPNENL